MYSLDNFQQHIDTLTRNDWNRLFQLLPEIESEDDANKSMEEDSLYRIQSKLLDMIFDLEINPHFGWSNWDEGIAILKAENSDYSALDTITLCKLITTITRADRFNEGYMRWCIRNGVFTKLIKALQNKVLDNGTQF